MDDGGRNSGEMTMRGKGGGGCGGGVGSGRTVVGKTASQQLTWIKYHGKSQNENKEKRATDWRCQ